MTECCGFCFSEIWLTPDTLGYTTRRVLCVPPQQRAKLEQGVCFLVNSSRCTDVQAITGGGSPALENTYNDKMPAILFTERSDLCPSNCCLHSTASQGNRSSGALFQHVLRKLSLCPIAHHHQVLQLLSLTCGHTKVFCYAPAELLGCLPMTLAAFFCSIST